MFFSLRERSFQYNRPYVEKATNSQAMLPLPDKGTSELLGNLTNREGVICNGLASHPGGGRNTPSRFVLQKPRQAPAAMSPSALKLHTTLWGDSGRGARFSKAPETIRARTAITKSRTLRSQSCTFRYSQYDYEERFSQHKTFQACTLLRS